MTLTILGLAGLLGIGTLYLTPTQPPTESHHNHPSAATTQATPKPTTQAFPQSNPTPSIAQPLLVAKPVAISPSAGRKNNLSAALDRNRDLDRNPALDTVPNPTDKQRNELASKFVEQFGKVLSDFWLNKINGYKRHIDAMLTPDDLARLNRLRVRWSMAEGGIATMLGATANGNTLTLNMGIGSSKPSKDLFHKYITVQKNRSRDHTYERGLKSEKSAESHDEVAEQEASKQNMMKELDLTMMLPFVRQMMLQDTSESGQILSGAISLSDQYRPNLDELRGKVLRDFSEFVDLMANQASTFVEQHKGELSKEDQEKVEDIRTKISEGIGEIKNQEKLLTAVYSFIFEPVVMLYNGSDINGLISSTITEPVAGLKLSENQTLKQNIPNPATGNVAINYTLNEPSQRTMLRVFDAAGNVVATADQGGRPAGDHTINLDVSNWNNGTYLYHLTTQTSNGERVFSKTMQVVK